MTIWDLSACPLIHISSSASCRETANDRTTSTIGATASPEDAHTPSPIVEVLEFSLETPMPRVSPLESHAQLEISSLRKSVFLSLFQPCPSQVSRVYLTDRESPPTDTGLSPLHTPNEKLSRRLAQGKPYISCPSVLNCNSKCLQYTISPRFP